MSNGKGGKRTVMPMITAPVLNAVQQLLQERGYVKETDERLGDYIARGLDLSSSQAETFIEALHEGKTLEQAQTEAGVVPKPDKSELLTDIARVIGRAMGRVVSTTGQA